MIREQIFDIQALDCEKKNKRLFSTVDDDLFIFLLNFEHDFLIWEKHSTNKIYRKIFPNFFFVFRLWLCPCCKHNYSCFSYFFNGVNDSSNARFQPDI